MARKRKHHRKSKVEKKKTSKIVKPILSSLIILLIITVSVLTFTIGEALWTIWVVEHRTQIIGFLLLTLITLILATPIIAEVDKNPRPLSGSDMDSKWLI
jgi:hypothetical protein